jgi:hypothetical protein
MNHRFATLAAGCALALAGVANQAYAVDSACSAPAGYTFDVFLSGASAPQQIISGIMNDIMTITGIVTDTGSATGASGNFRVFCGTTKPPLPAGSVRVNYRARGGSAFGVFPVAQRKPIAWMDVDDPACTAAAGPCPIKGNDTGTSGVVPDLGVSDLQPDMFRAPFNIGPPFLSPPWTSAVTGLTIFPTNLVGFGIPVTNNVTLPNVTEVQMRQVFTGAAATWGAIGATTLQNSPIHICRRARGSGTQAVYNHFFNGRPLVSDGTVPPQTNPVATNCGNNGIATCDASAGRLVIENTSTGDVRNCLNAAQTGGNYSFVDDRGLTVTVQFSAGGPHGAVGTISLENRGGTTGEPANWTFRQLEGVDATNPDNLTTGLHDLMYEQTCQRRTNVLGTNYLGKPYSSQIGFINAFCGSLQKETVLKTASAAVVNSVRALPGVQGNCAPGSAGCISSFCRRLPDTRYKMLQAVQDPGGNQCP